MAAAFTSDVFPAEYAGDVRVGTERTILKVIISEIDMSKHADCTVKALRA